MFVVAWSHVPRRTALLCAGLFAASVLACHVRPGGHILRGAVSSGGSPVTHGWLQFAPVGAPEDVTVSEVGTDGEYRVRLKQHGQYRLTFFPLRHVPVGSVEIDDLPGTSRVDIELPDSRVTFARADSATPLPPWQVRLYDVSNNLLAGADLAGIIRPTDLVYTLVGLRRTHWRVFFDAPPDFISPDPIDIDLVRQTSVVIRVPLRAGASTITTRDLESSSPVAAEVFADSKLLRSDAFGRTALPRVAPSSPLVVIAAGYAPTCTLAPGWSQSIFVDLRRPAPRRLQLVLGPETKWPFGGLQSEFDQCLIPSKRFESHVFDTRHDQIKVAISHLADSRYRFQTSPSLQSTAAMELGAVEAVYVPVGCTICGTQYPAKVEYRRLPQKP